MTFTDLNTKLGDNEKQSDWTQHPNGGGWINKTAKVDDTAFVGGNAIVWGMVFGNARISGDAWVFGNAWVYGNAWVSDNAQVSGNAQVFGNTWTTSPLFIIGSKHSLTNAKHGYIQIGCKCETFQWWLSKEALAFAKESGYTAAEIEEYQEYVKLFMKVGK